MCFSYKAHSQIDYGISGYIFNLSSYSQTRYNKILGIIDIPSEESYSNLLRARLRPTFNIGDNSRFEIQYEVNGILSNRNLFILTEISENRRQLVKLANNLYTDQQLALNHYIDRMFFKHIFDFGEVTIGRQRISWGVGRIWQPADLFNPINPANFSKIEKDGADAVSMKFYLGNFTDFEIVYNPTKQKYPDNIGGRLRTNYSGYDISGIFGHFDDAFLIGGDFAGSILDAGFRGEFVYSFDDGYFGQDFLKFILGLDYQFNQNIYGMIEYQHNGLGTNIRNSYDYIKLARGEILNVGTDYLAVNLAYRLSDLTTLSLTSNSNLIDGSGFLMFTGIYQAAQNWQINLSTMASYGEKGTEYRIYPISAFFVCQYYF
ncbi:MAG: hypothetical protein KIT33_15265 [Candidatus Kapabacteria bacterium]|nr:hypothetical protein [Ignavibacteriota bacterium]MCW5886328.1 hypothetical protein [Candidatus Kapabacteria bacterium]